MKQTYFKVKSSAKSEELLHVMELIKRYFTGKVLDAGCGTGRHLPLMPEGSVGLDVDATILRKHKKEKYNFIVADLNAHLPFRQEIFDVILCSHVLEHLLDPNLALSDLNRVLKTNGCLIVAVPNPDYPFFNFYNPNWKGHLHKWSFFEARSFIEEHGFTVDKTFFNYPKVKNKLFGWVWNNIPLIRFLAPDFWFVGKKEKACPFNQKCSSSIKAVT